MSKDEKKKTLEDVFGTKAEREIQRLLNNDFQAYMSIMSKLDMLLEETKKNNYKLDELEETVSFFAYIPTRGLRLYYDHKKQDLYFQRNLSVHFTGDEADVLSIMFKKKDGRPHKKKFYCAEVAEKLAEKNREKKTANSVFLTVGRIQRKIDKQYRLGQVFTVTTKEFYFTRKTNQK